MIVPFAAADSGQNQAPTSAFDGPVGHGWYRPVLGSANTLTRFRPHSSAR